MIYVVLSVIDEDIYIRTNQDVNRFYVCQHDICKTKRKIALDNGAIECDGKKVVELIRKYR